MFGMLEGIDVLLPDQVETIHQAYMQTVEGATEGKAILSRVAHELSVDAIALAGTDLSLILTKPIRTSCMSIARKSIFRPSCINCIN
jgi:hypothetical protein